MRMLSSVLLLVVVQQASTAVETDAEIKGRLLASYGPSSTRPGLAAALRQDEGDTCSKAPPDHVEVQVWVEQMLPLNFKEGTYGFSGYLRAWWRDTRLAFNSSCVDKLSFGKEDRDAIWKCDERPPLHMQHSRLGEGA
jgi:hypothetical protein